MGWHKLSVSKGSVTNEVLRKNIFVRNCKPQNDLRGGGGVCLYRTLLVIYPVENISCYSNQPIYSARIQASNLKDLFSLACCSTLIMYYAHRIALHTPLVVIDFAFTVYTLWVINCPIRYCLCICTYCLCIPNVSSIFAWITSREFRTIFGTRLRQVFVIKSAQTHKINLLPVPKELTLKT